MTNSTSTSRPTISDWLFQGFLIAVLTWVIVWVVGFDLRTDSSWFWWTWPLIWFVGMVGFEKLVRLCTWE